MATQALQAGFAKLQGEDFEFFVQRYSVVLGRGSKKSATSGIDLDLTAPPGASASPPVQTRVDVSGGSGGGMNISRQHARLFYDFTARKFALEVLGKNGVLVSGQLHLPGTPPVVLKSQDLLQIGDKKFYFLLPVQRYFVCDLYSWLPTPLHGPWAYSSTPNDLSFLDKSPAAAQAQIFVQNQNVALNQKAALLNGERHSEPAEKSNDNDRDLRHNAALEASHTKAMQTDGTEHELLAAVSVVLSYPENRADGMPIARLNAELMDSGGELYARAYREGVLSVADVDAENEDVNHSGSEAANKRPKAWAGLAQFLRKHPGQFSISKRKKGPKNVEFVAIREPVDSPAAGET